MSTLRDDILLKTDGGRKVFTHYFGKQAGRKVFLNVYRQDTSPSCVLKKKNDRYYLKDYGNHDWYGDCFTVVAKIEHLDVKADFPKLMSIINKELNLGLDIPATVTPSRRVTDLPDVNTESSSAIVRYSYHSVPLDSLDHHFWGRYGITKDVLQRYGVLHLTTCTCYYADGTSFTIRFSEQYPLYAYLFTASHDGIRTVGMKVYRPGAKFRFLQLGSVPRPYRFGWRQLPDGGDYLYIVGGEKDVMTMVSHGFIAVCYNSETATIPSADMHEYSRRFQRIIILYDMDATGRQCSSALVAAFRTDATSLSVFCGSLPLSGKKFDKDVSDYFAKAGHDRSTFLRDLSII